MAIVCLFVLLTCGFVEAKSKKHHPNSDAASSLPVIDVDKLADGPIPAAFAPVKVAPTKDDAPVKKAHATQNSKDSLKKGAGSAKEQKASTENEIAVEDDDPPQADSAAHKDHYVADVIGGLITATCFAFGSFLLLGIVRLATHRHNEIMQPVITVGLVMFVIGTLFFHWAADHPPSKVAQQSDDSDVSSAHIEKAAIHLPGWARLRSQAFAFTVTMPQPLTLDRSLKGRHCWVTNIRHTAGEGKGSLAVSYSRETDYMQSDLAQRNAAAASVPVVIGGSTTTYVFDPSKTCDLIAQADAELIHGTILSKNVTSLDDIEGRDVYGSRPDNEVFHFRLYVTPSCEVYQVATLGQKSYVDSAESQKFLDSLLLGEEVSNTANRKDSVASQKPASASPKTLVRKAATSGPNAIVGTWDWFTNGPVTFYSNGTQVQGSITGAWRLTGRTLRTSWSNGWYSTQELSADGRTLDGYGSQDPNTLGTQHAWGTKITP